jgi:hypothetical protein
MLEFKDYGIEEFGFRIAMFSCRNNLFYFGTTTARKRRR